MDPFALVLSGSYFGLLGGWRLLVWVVKNFYLDCDSWVE